MDNNSNTLFGFEAITDVLSNENYNGSGFIDEEIDDEELERLQQESKKYKKSVKDVFGSSKDNKKEVDEDDEEEEDTEEEEIVDTKKSSKTKKTKPIKEEELEDEEEIEHNEDSEEDDDSTEESEDKTVVALFDAIAEEIGWEFEDDEKAEKPKTVEELVGYFKDVIAENSTPEYASEDVKLLDEYVRNGGKLENYFAINRDLDLDNFDITVESNQKLIVKELLKEKGFTDKQIERKIEKYEDAGILEDEAEDAVETMKEIKEHKKEQLLENQKKQKAEMAVRQQKFVDDVVETIKSMNDIRGIKIPERDKKELLTYLFKADANGTTQYKKDYSKSVKNLIESAYFTMKGDILLDTAKKIGTSSAMKTLKESLKSTGAGKGTKRINTSSSNSIWSRAVQSLI